MKKFLFISLIAISFFFVKEVNAVSYVHCGKRVVTEEALDYIKAYFDTQKNTYNKNFKDLYVCGTADGSTLMDDGSWFMAAICPVEKLEFVATNRFKCLGHYNLRYYPDNKVTPFAISKNGSDTSVYEYITDNNPIYKISLNDFSDSGSSGSSSGESSSIDLSELKPYFILTAFCSCLIFLAVMWKRRSYL